jgi:hypothetical protein
VSDTTTMPTRAMQDGAHAFRPGEAAPDTATRLDAAQEADGRAVANHEGAMRRAEMAGAAHRTAIANRQTLLNRAAEGETVNITDLRRAGASVLEAKDAMDLATSIASGAGTIVERAAIAMMKAQAEHIRAGDDVTVANQISKAANVDTAYRTLQAAIIEHGDAQYDVMVAGNLVHSHNASVVAAAATNRTLAALQPAERPTARAPANVQPMPLTVAFVTDRWGDVAVDPIRSVAAVVRAGHGIADKPQRNGPTLPPDVAPVDLLSPMVGRLTSFTPTNPAFITGGRLNR